MKINKLIVVTLLLSLSGLGPANQPVTMRHPAPNGVSQICKGSGIFHPTSPCKDPSAMELRSFLLKMKFKNEGMP